MRYVFTITMFFITTTAYAQQVFVPLTVTEQDARNLRAYLDDQPMKFSLPIVQWMDALEQKAIKDGKKSDVDGK